MSSSTVSSAINAPATWLAADWGTSRLRLWALDAQDVLIGERSSDNGMGQLKPEQFEAALLELAEPFLAADRVTDVLICGMAGARQGWIEAPYLDVPGSAVGAEPVPAPTTDPRLRVRILPGLCQRDPADVMRGEETQLAGFAAQNPGYSGAVCLPGTHTKWVRMAGEQVQAFRTLMTGETFALLGAQSILRHSLDDNWDDDAFGKAVLEALQQPEQLIASLFSIRAASLLTNPTPGSARARLSGLLIGAELAGTRDYWQGATVTLIGADQLVNLYTIALRHCGATAMQADGAGLALAGLKAAHQQLREAEQCAAI
jgi:2-dehydro-3-deoxygalactonokinase